MVVHLGDAAEDVPGEASVVTQLGDARGHS